MSDHSPAPAPMWRQWLVLVLRVGLGGIFVCAGVLKMRNPGPFADSVASFRLLPVAINNLAAMGLPPLEILAGGLLLLATGRWRRAGAFAVLAMLGVFVVALGAALARGLVVDCGCFGTDGLDVLAPAKNLWLAIGRDVLFVGCAWPVYQETRREHP